ncbi:23097_t:CDS:2, partial [Racocetra persica]
MDSDFVRVGLFSEPLKGIDEGIVKYRSINKPHPSEEAAFCLARLTMVATENFKQLSDANKTEYFKALLQEVSKKLPVRSELLSTDNNYQYISINSKENAQFAIRVGKTNPKIDNHTTVPGIISDLNNMIRYKRITTFSSGLTNDLDETYGFRPKGDLIGDYKDKIIPFFAAGGVNLMLYIFSQFSSKSEDFKQTLNIVSGGVFTATHTSFSSIFAFSDAKGYPFLSLPSGLILVISLLLNVVMFTYILCRGGIKQLNFMNFLTILLSLYNGETLLLLNDVKLHEIFNEQFDLLVKYRAFADIFIKNIPQLVIQ